MMKLFASLAIAGLTFVGPASVFAVPIAAPEPAPTVSPISTKPAYEFCAFLASQYGGKTINLGAIDSILGAVGGKRDEHEAGSDLQKRDQLSAALPGGRTYTVLPGSRGHRDAASNYYGYGGGAFGPCVVFSYGGAYFNAEFIQGDPARVITPFSSVGNSFTAATQFCQAICDNLPRFQSALSGGSTTCNAIVPWIEVDSGNPLNAFGYNFVCDLYPKALTSKNIAPLNPSQYSTGLLANAN